MIRKSILLSFLLLQPVIGFASRALAKLPKSTKASVLRAKRIAQDYFQRNPKIAKFKKPKQPKVAKISIPVKKDGGENRQPTLPALSVSPVSSSDLESIKLDQENAELKQMIKALIVQNMIEAKEQELLEKEEALEQEKLKKIAWIKFFNEEAREREVLQQALLEKEQAFIIQKLAQLENLKNSEPKKQSWLDWVKDLVQGNKYPRSFNLDDPRYA